MIEIIVTCNGKIDRAEADTPENAIFAGQTLFDEAYRANFGAFQPVVLFRGPDGFTTRLKVGRRP